MRLVRGIVKKSVVWSLHLIPGLQSAETAVTNLTKNCGKQNSFNLMSHMFRHTKDRLE